MPKPTISQQDDIWQHHADLCDALRAKKIIEMHFVSTSCCPLFFSRKKSALKRIVHNQVLSQELSLTQIVQRLESVGKTHPLGVSLTAWKGYFRKQMDKEALKMTEGSITSPRFSIDVEIV